MGLAGLAGLGGGSFPSLRDPPNQSEVPVCNPLNGTEDTFGSLPGAPKRFCKAFGGACGDAFGGCGGLENWVGGGEKISEIFRMTLNLP